MRIVLAVDHFPPEPVYGYDRAVSNLSRQLAERGHRVTVLAPRWSPELAAQESWHGVRVERYQPLRVPHSLWMLGRSLRWRGVKDLLRANAAAHDILLGLPHYILAAKRWAPSLKTVYRAGGTLLGAKRWEGFIWPEGHSLRAKLASYFSWTRMLARERKAMWCADRIVTPSQNIRRQMEYYYGMPQGRVAVIPNGSDPAVFAPPAVRRDGVSRILATGRLDTIKNHELLIDAVHRMRSRDAVDVRIAGEGALRPRLESQIRRLGLESRVALLGYCHEVQEQYRWADVFVLPSIHEPFGNVLMEAMSCGLPLVGLRSVPPEVWTPNEEFIAHEVNGLLVDRPDPALLAAALDRLVAQPELCRRMGDASRRRAEEQYTLQLTIDRYEQLFRDTLA